MRTIGIDVGKISFKAVLLGFSQGSQQWEIKKFFWEAHKQKIEEVWQKLRAEWQIGEGDKVVATGRFRKMLPFSSIVEKVSQQEAARFLYPEQDLAVIRLGGGGFSVLKIKNSGQNEFSQNPPCAAGVGSFLDQIMSRVNLTVVQADQLARDAKGLEITKRCGVTMKTDFTHLLNTGQKIADVVAGLLDSSAKSAVELASKTKIPNKVLVIGGLSVLGRIIKTIQEKLSNQCTVAVPSESLYFEALGAALVAGKMADKKNFFLSCSRSCEKPLVYLAPLKDSLNLVTKIGTLPCHLKHKVKGLSAESNEICCPVMGLDIGSTGSKLVIFDQTTIFEFYSETQGQPVETAKKLIRRVPLGCLKNIRAVGCTGSGRDIVSSLLKATLPENDSQMIFVLNEIAAHAQGAQFYDKEVDTIVDIGGQDAKFIRLEEGRVVDSCMNTVCSAGTGSFLAEQLQLLGIRDIKQLGKMALESPRAVDLGQHCAVFIAEQIDEAKRKGAQLQEIIAGLYYSIVQNYNNRVKGARDYGRKIFLQGKPAENLALACALSKVSGKPIIVPPSPGTPGALGIALLAKKEFGKDLSDKKPLDLNPFLKSQISEKKEFRCSSRDGCLTGNLCPIQAIKVNIGQQERTFFWGGACDKYEKKAAEKLILAKAPHPFIERENLITSFLNKGLNATDKTVGIPRGLETEEILPLAVTFFQELGFKVKLSGPVSLKVLEEGAKLCQATFCAPLQILGGQAKLQENENFVFLPKIVEIPGVAETSQLNRCYVCPLSQAVPDLFSPKLASRVLQPILNFKDSYWQNKEAFLKMGVELEFSQKEIHSAFVKAIDAQEMFEDECRKIGEQALEFASQNKIPAVVVLGHPYIVNCSLISAGIPESIRENGAMAIPADCYSVYNQTANLGNMYWGYGRRLLQATYGIRRQPGVYPLWLSVYSCGPDSFLLHFFQYLAQGKPYAVLESDAYIGQAGFKTRVEAFLYGVKHYQRPQNEVLTDFGHFHNHENIAEIRASGRKMLIPWMGENSIVLSAIFNSMGIESEYLTLGDQENLALGRKFTSGKECLPMIVTLGGLLKYQKDHQGDFYYFMPQADGPCRFGQYQLLFKIILEKLGLGEKVKVISPTAETGYQRELKLDSAVIAKTWAALVFSDLLRDALHDIRPEERRSGITQEIFDTFVKKTKEIVSKKNNNWLGFKDIWGLEPLAKRAAWHFQQISRDEKKKGKPTVLVTGEIYVRLDSFSNNDVVGELENMGVKVKLAPFREWGDYVTWMRLKKENLISASRLKIHLTDFVQRFIEKRLYQIFAKALNWPADHHIEEILAKAKPYLQGLKPLGEAALTIGLPLLLWQKQEIAGVVAVGPFECMPTRIAETQLNLISQQTGLPVLTLSFYGEPLERDALESFIWDLKK